MSSAGQHATRDEAFLASRAPSLSEEAAPEYPQASYYRARYYDPQGGRFISEDPLGFEAGSDFYVYVMNDPTYGIDPSGLDTTVIIVYDHGIGSHAAVLVDNGGNPVLYDPAGGYGEDHKCSEKCIDQLADVKKYMDYHTSTGETVKLFVFKTTLAEEKQIYQNIIDAESSIGGFCSIAVSTVLNGIGPFGNLGTYLLPGNLGRALGAIKHPYLPPGTGGKK